MSNEMSPNTDVWIMTQNSGNASKVLHLSSDCRAIRDTTEVVKKKRNVFPDDQPVCDFCTGEYEHNPVGHTDAYLKAVQADPEKQRGVGK